MKKAILPIFISVIISFAGINNSNSKNLSSHDPLYIMDNPKDSTDMKPDISKVVIYLDGVRVNEEILKEKSKNGEKFSGTGTTIPRLAIKLCGEKYRNGLVFFETEKNKKP